MTAMGLSAKGEIWYGYHLGGGEEGWLLAEYERDPETWETRLRVPWVMELEDALTPQERFARHAQRRLEDHMGGMDDAMRKWYQVTEPETRDRLRRASVTAQNRTTVSLVSYGHHEFPYYLLAIEASEIQASWGEAEELDVLAMAAVPEDEGWRYDLAKALEILQITPLQAEPRWLLVSDYG